jgi:NAD(P)-dependent dehydrogenase (short-subunit alcohol dehydrogenase family)
MERGPRPADGRGIVLVTGGTGGIGKTTVIGLATMGTHVAITGRDPVRAQAAGREIRAAGSGQMDPSSQAEVRLLAGEALQRLPRMPRLGRPRLVSAFVGPSGGGTVVQVRLVPGRPDRGAVAPDPGDVSPRAVCSDDAPGGQSDDESSARFF